MDYKYIEQLLESYFACTTTLQEEQILRSFFSQENVPGHLMQYADLFRFETAAKEDALDEAFDQRMMALVEEATHEAHTARMTADHTEKMTTARTGKTFLRTFSRNAAPFFKAAAVVAIALTIGQATERAIGEQAADEKSNAVAIDPYIKSGDIMQTIRVKDVSQAETNTRTDSLMGIGTVNDKIQ